MSSGGLIALTSTTSLPPPSPRSKFRLPPCIFARALFKEDHACDALLCTFTCVSLRVLSFLLLSVNGIPELSTSTRGKSWLKWHHRSLMFLCFGKSDALFPSGEESGTKLGQRERQRDGERERESMRQRGTGREGKGEGEGKGKGGTGS